MGIDLRENGNGFDELKSHMGHIISVVGYGLDPEDSPVNVAIECLDILNQYDMIACT